jgi:anti-sigma regulatory factor (Ser/Thr protein kinase)
MHLKGLRRFYEDTLMAMRTIVVKAFIDQLPSVNRFLAEAVGPDFQPLIQKIRLAVEELMVNVSSYAYGQAGGDAEISCRPVNFDGRPNLKISIRDWGRAFDPFGEAPEPDTFADLSERPVGGLGIHLVKKMVSHYCYEFGESNLSELFFERPDV